MKLFPTTLDGAWLIEMLELRDERGFFARTFCADFLRSAGLESMFPQHSMSATVRRGAVRGLHFQNAPAAEVKIVRCLKGAIWDVMVDLRPDSPNFCRWEAFELSAENRRQLYVPKGFAHGFQSLVDNVEVAYLISEYYAPDAASGVRYDDPAFGIAWPLPITTLSAKDRSWADFKRED